MIPDRYLAKWAFAAAMILAPTGCGPEQAHNRSEQEAAYIKIEVVKHCEAKAQEVQP